MKRLFFAFVAIAALTLSLTSCEKESETIIDFSALPKVAQTTITEHFNKDNIMLVIYDKELFDKEYSVTFFDGTLIEFDKSGSWESVESNSVGVPTSILHSKIAEYLEVNFTDNLVLELDKDNNGYELRLDNSVELEFNLSGVLIGADMD